MQPIEGPGGIECYQIRHESGAEATVARHGGHLISWITADGRERLYLSPKANYSHDQAIRGGVPVIFPQFSDHGPFGRHGFARKSEWDVNSDQTVFALSTSLESRKGWPHDFLLNLNFELNANNLSLTLAIANPGDLPFEFHAALHTYLRVSPISSAQVMGLENLGFLNEATKQMEGGESDAISFGQEIDRAYLGAGSKEALLKSACGSVRIQSEGFPDLVVWNPGPDHGIGDLPTDGWTDFVCVESAITDNYYHLEPGENWKGKQTLTTF